MAQTLKASKNTVINSTKMLSYFFYFCELIYTISVCFLKNVS